MARSVILAVLALLFAAPPAFAQPPTEPAPPRLPAHPLAPLAQSGSPAGPAGLPPQLIGPGGEFVLGQHAVPSAPGVAPATPPHLNAWNNQYLLPQNLEPSAPGEGTVFGVEPGQENADIRGIDYVRRLWEMYQAGGLDGGLLGQRPVESLNKPLPEPSAPAPAPGA
ncbi:hypothetical protein ACQI4F_10190 [Mycolicibacterium vaccae]|uniref:hypothetical protein n=1 Tax=Mycolicibacterium vaccae TaxID=1810 RepID=UPI003CF0C1B1